jgi:hypothetical protein
MRLRPLPRQPGRRRASLAAQLLFTLPVLLTLLLGIIEMSLLMTVQQHLQTASREAARVAALGGTQDEVTQSAQLFLGNGPLSQADIDAVLTDDSGQPLPSGSPVAVTISIQATQAVPDLLAFVGFSLRKDRLAAQTVLRKE